MTHAYLHILHGLKIKPHGKEFKIKINAINEILKINITSTHNFIYWWRCSGKCQTVPALFYGYVSSTDTTFCNSNNKWQESHKKLCSGFFQMCNEPSNEILKRIKSFKCKRKTNLKIEDKCKETKNAEKCKKYNIHFRSINNIKRIRYSTDDD